HLGVAKGDEVFVPLGSDEIQHPEPGEIIYFSDEDKQVLCRRMNWRASEILKITEDTTQTIINVEGVGIIPRSHVQAAHEELAQLLKEHCSAELKMEFLNKENPSTGFNF
ncbi:MAG: hypothetical protein Q8P95_00010, partial [bacterium]|nr:hypothetical protein [bacterium]